MRHDPSTNGSLLWGLCESKVKLALHELHMENRDCLKGLIPCVAPAKFRGVVASRAFAAGGIVLAPMTTTISNKKHGDPIPNGAVRLDEGITMPGSTPTRYVAILMPAGGIKLPSESEHVDGKVPPIGFLALYWLVRTSAVSADVNMVTKRVLSQGVAFHVLTNKKEIKAGAELVRAAPAAPEANAKAAQKDAERGAPAAKRQKL